MNNQVTSEKKTKKNVYSLAVWLYASVMASQATVNADQLLARLRGSKSIGGTATKAVKSTGSLAPNLNAIGIGTRPLDTLDSYRAEMVRIYQALASGHITDKQGGRLIWMLDVFRRAKLDEDKLELVRSGGVVDSEPFTGFRVIGPSDKHS